MPQLNESKASVVRNSDTTSPFEPIPEGHYKFKLVKVESGKSARGSAMWTWFFASDKPKKKLREYTVLDDDALWKVAQIFQAFGADPATSTDTLIGKEIILHIGVEIATQGKLEGKKVNYIVGYPDQKAAQVGPFEEQESDDPEVAEDTPKPAPKARTRAKKTEKTDESPDF